MDDMTAALARAHAHATEFLDGLDRRSVAATARLSQLRQRLCLDKATLLVVTRFHWWFMRLLDHRSPGSPGSDGASPYGH